MDLSENLPTQLKEPLRNSPKPKLDIKMPDMRFEGHDEGMKLLSQDKRSNRMNHAVDEGNLDVAMPSEDKSSSRSVGKQESFASDIITIQENSPIESVLDDSLVSSKSLSRSKTSRQLPSTANEEFPRHEGKTKAGPKSEKGKQSEKLFEMSRKKSSSVNSSIVKRSKISEKPSETVSKPRSNLRSREHSFEEKNIPKTELKKASSDRSLRNSKHSRSSRGDSVIDESINTLEDGSEIVSELSHIEKSVNERTADGSVNVSSKPGRSIAEDASAVISSRLKHPAGENGYAYDTFEDISSSTMRSKSGSQSGRTIDGKKNTINLTDNRNTSDVKISSDKGSSNYTRNVENIDAKTHKRTSRRKSSLEMTSASQQESNREEREKVSNETRERLMMDVLALTVADDEERTQRSKSGSSRETSKPMKSGSSREKIESTKSGSSKEKSKSTKSGSSREKVESTKSDSSRKESEPTKSTSSREKSESTKSDSSREKIKSTKSGSSREKSEPTKSTSSRKKNEESEEDEDILVENSDRRIPSNVTNVLRKLHRDSIGAMVKRHASLNTMEHVYESSSGRKTEPEALEATSRRIARTKEKSSSHHRSSERDKTVSIDIFLLLVSPYFQVQFLLFINSINCPFRRRTMIVNIALRGRREKLGLLTPSGPELTIAPEVIKNTRLRDTTGNKFVNYRSGLLN